MRSNPQPVTEQAVMSNLGLTDADLARRKQLVGLGPEDVERLVAIRDVVTQHVDELTETFFTHLAGVAEARVLLGYRELTNQARVLKRAHLLQMVQGTYDLGYAEQRVRLGLLYGRVGLGTKVFVGAFGQVVAKVGDLVMQNSPTPAEGFARFISFQKLAFFDMGIHNDVTLHERERTIGRQSEAIRELSTPVLQIRDGLLLLPLIGVVDTHRAQLITENLLRAIRETRARVVVIDVTGVATIDTKVANHLLQTVTAARLMGARAIVSGVSADVAQSMVSLGIELSPFQTVGDLQGGLEHAERLLGYRAVRVE